MCLTYFAPAERAPAEELARAVQAVDGDTTAVQILEYLPQPAFVLNEQRQILFANRAARQLAVKERSEMLGLRPGDALGCAQAPRAPSGCGTGKDCRECGAVKAIMASMISAKSVSLNCQFSGVEPRCITGDFKVTAYSVQLDGLPLTALMLEDIGAERRRVSLERAFFHDIMNTAAGLDGLARLLSLGAIADQDAWRFKQRLAQLAEALIEEIQHQRKLLQAEAGDVKPSEDPVQVHRLLEDLQQLHAASPVARNRVLRLVESPDVVITSDRVMLRRILGNLIKNALEATVAGGAVSLSAVVTPGGLEFSVHNPGVIPEKAQAQLFHRSFTTKSGSGRGVGAYSVKLFGERCLGGKVTFTTNETEGTRFTFLLPASPIRVSQSLG